MNRKKAVVAEMEYLEYKDSLTPDELKYVQQFYNEYYAKGSNWQDDPLLTSNEQLKEARRTNNYYVYKDAFTVARNLGKLDELSPSEREVMELGSDELDWESAYAQGGPEFATDIIFKQAERDIKNSITINTALARFYVKMEKLRKQTLKEKRKVKNGHSDR